MSQASGLPALSGYPTADVLARNAYDVLASWNPGRSVEFRQMVVLIGVLFAILVLAAATLLPRRIRVAAIALLSVGFTLGIMLWSRSHPPIARLTGTISVLERGATQTDRWNVFTSPVEVRGELQWTEGTVALVDDDSRADRIALERDAAGRPTRFLFTIPAGGKVAFVTRASGSLSPGAGGTFDGRIFEELANRCYLRDGLRIARRDGDAIVISD